MYSMHSSRDIGGADECKTSRDPCEKEAKAEVYRTTIWHLVTFSCNVEEWSVVLEGAHCWNVALQTLNCTESEISNGHYLFAPDSYDCLFRQSSSDILQWCISSAVLQKDLVPFSDSQKWEDTTTVVGLLSNSILGVWKHKSPLIQVNCADRYLSERQSPS